MVFRVQLRTALLPRKRKLQCRNGHYLEVRPDGTVRGTKNNDSIYSKYKKYITIYRSFDSKQLLRISTFCELQISYFPVGHQFLI